MKYLFFSLVMLVATSATLFSQSNDEQAVRQILEIFQAAIRDNKADEIERFFSKDYMFFVQGSPRLNKVQRLESIRSGQIKFGTFKNEDVKITLYEKAAGVIIKTNVKYKEIQSGKDVTVAIAVLGFVKTDNQWLISGECYLPNNCFR
ncbi:MAG: nuclear transport factor 2 family protein [Ferruginibacter sp.]